MLERPLVVCLHQDRVHRSDDGRLVGEDTHDIGAALQPLPGDEVAAVERHVCELDPLGEDLKRLDQLSCGRDPGRSDGRPIDDHPRRRPELGTGRVAAIGDVHLFATPQKLVSYFGLNPRARQSGPHAAHYGRISKAGRSHARAMLVEAAWTAAKTPGPLNAFFVRIRAKRGQQIAAWRWRTS